MRILLSAHAFLPRSVAGVEVYTARLAAALQALGHAVQVVTAVHDLSARPYSSRRTEVGGIEVVEIVNPHLEGGLRATYRVAAIDRELAVLLERFRPDCVHVQHLLNLSSGLIDAARAAGASTVLTLHDYWLGCPRDGLRMRADGALCATIDHRVCAGCLRDSPYLVPAPQRALAGLARRAGLGAALHRFHALSPRAAAALGRLARRVSPRPSGLERAMDERAAHLRERVAGVDLVLAPTRFAEARALEWGVDAARLRVLSLGAVVQPARARPAGARRRLGCVGTLAPHKGAHVLLEAARGLSRSDWTLDLFGNDALDPRYTGRLRALAGADARIRFRGRVAPDEQHRIWSSIDLLVAPSLWWENSPLTVLEALAAGIPVIASRTGGMPELLPPGAGTLVEPGDVGGLRQAIGEALDGRSLASPLDPLPIKTALDGARELVGLYGAVSRQARP